MGNIKIAWVLDGLPLCGGVKIPFGYCRELQKLGIDSQIYANGRNPELEEYYGVKVLPINQLESFTDSDVIIGVWWMQLEMLEKYKGRKMQFVQGFDPYGMSDTYSNNCLDARSRNWEVLAVSDYAGSWVGKPFTVIPNAVDEIFHKTASVIQEIDALIEGVDEPNKNIMYSVRKAQEDGHKFIVWFARETHAIPGVVSITNPDQEHIAILYKSAKNFYKHSISEGFSLPLAEAIVSGCTIHTHDMGGNKFEGLDFKWDTSVRKLLSYLDIRK